jgi:hypothetical protein
MVGRHAAEELICFSVNLKQGLDLLAEGRVFRAGLAQIFRPFGRRAELQRSAEDLNFFSLVFVHGHCGL